MRGVRISLKRRRGLRNAGAAILVLGLTCGLAGAAGAWPDRLDGHGGPVRGIAVSEDRSELLSASFDYAIIHRSLTAGNSPILHRLFGHEAAVNDVEFVPGRPLAVSASDDGSVGVWDLDEGTLVTRFRDTGDKILDVTVSDDGAVAASAGWDHTARVYDLETMSERAVMRGHDGNVNTVALAGEGNILYSGSYDGTVRQWNARSGEQLRIILKHGWGVNIVRVLPDETHLLFGAVDGASGIVDIASGEVVAEFEAFGGPVLAAAIDTDHGLAAVGSANGHLRVYRLGDWTLLNDYSTAYGPIWSVDFAPDGTAVYRAGLDDFVSLVSLEPGAPLDVAETDFPRRFQLTDDMDTGERQFARKCSVCHTLTPDDANRAGPTLYGVFGRRVGTLPDYPYSDALKNSDIIWSEETISRLFDHGPDVVLPGTKMPVQRLKDAEERAALVAFLKRATSGEMGND